MKLVMIMFLLLFNIIWSVIEVVLILLFSDKAVTINPIWIIKIPVNIANSLVSFVAIMLGSETIILSPPVYFGLWGQSFSADFKISSIWFCPYSPFTIISIASIALAVNVSIVPASFNVANIKGSCSNPDPLHVLHTVSRDKSLTDRLKLSTAAL